jgi:hypothetical protein
MEFFQNKAIFHLTETHKPKEFRLLNIQMDFGNAPMLYQPSRKEKLVLELTKISKHII